MQYKHLERDDRNQIEILVKRGYKQVEIGKVLGFKPSSISREISTKKCEDGVYRARIAQHKADNGRRSSKYQGMKIEGDQKLKEKIILMLKEKQSPDGIAGRLRLEGHNIGKDAIYKWLYSSWGQQYCPLLCTKRYRKRKHRKTTQRVMIPNRVPLALRPEKGTHWQGDCFVSPRKAQTTACASVVVEEESKFVLGRRMPNLKVKTMTEAVRNMLSHVYADTLTLDNGIENRGHEDFGVSSYFCTARSPWEKGLVEQTIGLIRRWFVPKGTDLRTLSNDTFQHHLDVINR